jgi:hypothetical protein
MTEVVAEQLLERAGRVHWVVGADLTVWLELNQRLRENPSLAHPGDFWEFTTRTTHDSVAIRLRCLLTSDKDPNTVSIASVIQAVSSERLVLTRARLEAIGEAAGVDPRSIEVVAEHFSHLCGGGAAVAYPPQRALADLERCRRAAEPLRLFVNDWVAHIKIVPRVQPPWLYQFVRNWVLARRMLAKYEFLLRGSHLEHPVKNWLGTHWQESFNKHWFSSRAR